MLSTETFGEGVEKKKNLYIEFYLLLKQGANQNVI